MRAAWDKLEALPSLAAVRSAARSLTRDYLLSMLQWNDRNASWTDAEADREGIDRSTKDEAVDAVVEMIRDSVWRYDDPRRESDPGPAVGRSGRLGNGSMRHVRLRDLVSGTVMQQLEPIMNDIAEGKLDVSAGKKKLQALLETERTELLAKGVLPDYLAWVLAAAATQGGGRLGSINVR